jgi:membrane protease YdiL (CAAX protease family)
MTFEEIGITEEKVKIFFESNKPSAIFFKYSITFTFVLFALSLILNINFIFRRKLPQVDFRAGVQNISVPWGILDIVRVGLVVIFIGYIIGIVEGLILRIFRIYLDMNLRMMLNTFFIDLCAGVVLLYFVVIKYKERLASIGLIFSSFFRNAMSGLASYIFIVPLLLVILIVSIWLLDFLGYAPPPQPVFEAFMEEKRSGILLFLTIFVAVFGPIAEEMFFRGFMYSAIKKRLGVLSAALLSAAIFSSLHTNIVGFLPIMTLGVLLAYLYETTGSLVASMTVHIVHNSIMIGFVFFIKELMG